MSTYARLIHRHRSALRIEKLFLVTVGIIATTLAQLAF